jgi:Uma2 family endonuclease
MVAPIQHKSPVVYPDSDGQPMSDNTVQFRWITVIHFNLDWQYADNPEVFVAGDLLWYPVEGNPKIRQAPDVMVAFGRPKGDRGSYKQWEEANVAPQVVFEILSPGNRTAEMYRKLLFYDRYGVEEYYVYDPDSNELNGCLRGESGLAVIEDINGWVSPRLQVRFELSEETLQLYNAQGEPFASYNEVRQRLEVERQRADVAEERARLAEERAERLAELLRQSGIDPDRQM